MAIAFKPLTSHFGAEVTGADIARDLNDVAFGEIRAAFDEYSVLIFPNQPMDDAQQIAFSERFGILEGTRALNPGSGTAFARQSNLDIKTGEAIPADDRRMFYQKANMLWHADSTFKAVPSLCSVLSAREIPPVGGATEFASTRAAYDELTDDEKSAFEELTIEHDFVYSRGTVGFTMSDDEAEMFPADLLARATGSDKIYRHDWRDHDVVVWDNQAVLHRATPYDAENHRRLMQRTTISSGIPAVPA